MQTGFESYQIFIFDTVDGTFITKIPNLMLMPFSEISSDGTQRILYGKDGLVIASNLQ